MLYRTTVRSSETANATATTKTRKEIGRCVMVLSVPLKETDHSLCDAHERNNPAQRPAS